MSQIWGLLYYLFPVYHLLLEVARLQHPLQTRDPSPLFSKAPEAPKINAMINSRQVLREDTHQ